jgi:atypical dual specificity phosphatase
LRIIVVLSPPASFSWIDRPYLAASARPDGPEELAWLRQQGIQILLSLSEAPLRRDWVDDAGLLVMHVPVEDMVAPTQGQLDRCVSALNRARAQNMGVVVHCAAGLGRTGSILAAYLVAQGFTPRAAITRVRELRPGSIETEEQEWAVEEFARRRATDRRSG